MKLSGDYKGELECKCAKIAPMKPRLVFMGSPEFAVPILQALAKNYPVAGVVTQPDRASGRGRAMTPPPLQLLAQELSIPTIQPLKLHQPEAMEQLRLWQPDIIIVAAFGQILRPAVLDLPPYGCLNVHASLLPRWRGAAPIQAAILHGDEQTGVTIMHMDPGVDTGPLLSQRALPIMAEDTAATLSERLAGLGASLLLETLPAYLEGELTPQAQDNAQATYAPMLKKEDGELDFNQPASDLARKVRAFNPWPGAYFTWHGQALKIHRATAILANELAFLAAPGHYMLHHGLPAIATSGGLLVLDELQLPGKKALPGKVFLQGVRKWA
jgi:methionyl-tRNA formyltransferase